MFYGCVFLFYGGERRERWSYVCSVILTDFQRWRRSWMKFCQRLLALKKSATRIALFSRSFMTIGILNGSEKGAGVERKKFDKLYLAMAMAIIALLEVLIQFCL